MIYQEKPPVSMEKQEHNNKWKHSKMLKIPKNMEKGIIIRQKLLMRQEI